MSGSYSIQQTTLDYQAWIFPPPLPEIPNSSPNVIFLNPQPATAAQYETIYTTIDGWWRVPDPLPTIPPFAALDIGAGATFTIFHPVWQNIVLQAWVPPDPLPTFPVQYGRQRFTPGGLPIPAPTPAGSVFPPHNVLANGAVPVYTLFNSLTGGAVPRAGTANTVTQGGEAVAAAIGPINGGFITNGDATSQNVSSESINIDMTAPPLAGDVNGYGTTLTLAASTTWTIPGPLAAGVTVWVNAATSGHRFTCVVW
jgi:hypothetical protein